MRACEPRQPLPRHAAGRGTRPRTRGAQHVRTARVSPPSRLQPGSIASATAPWGAIELVGRTPDNEVTTYWWATGSAGWTYESITAERAGDTPPITGSLSFTLGRDGSQHIAGVSADGEVIHLYWLPDGQDLWRSENLSAMAI